MNLKINKIDQERNKKKSELANFYFDIAEGLSERAKRKFSLFSKDEKKQLILMADDLYQEAQEYGHTGAKKKLDKLRKNYENFYQKKNVYFLN